MWLGLLSLLPLACFPVFRTMVKTLPLTIFTTLASSYRKTLALIITSRNIVKVIQWAFGQIWSGNSQIIKDLALLKTRSWLTKKFRLGDLQVYPKRYELTYYEDDRCFRVCFPKMRGPKKIVSVKTQEEVLVTEEVFEAMGPSNNFHGIQTTPELLGYPGGLRVTYRNDVIAHCLGDDLIKISVDGPS